MLCPTCHGRHFVATPHGDRPCPECGGMGEVHCCDGLREQADDAPYPCNYRHRDEGLPFAVPDR